MLAVEGTVTNTHWHLVFNTETSFGTFDAADIFLELQAPVGDVFPEVEITGVDLGWSGPGVFEADVDTDAINGPILIGKHDPDADFSLWFFRLLSIDETNPLLGGQFIDSYIDVTIEPVPTPGALPLGAALLLALRRQRRPNVGRLPTSGLA